MRRTQGTSSPGPVVASPPARSTPIFPEKNNLRLARVRFAMRDRKRARVLDAATVSARVLLGDGIEGLNSLAPHSVSLLLSDLPSGQTRASFDKAPDFTRLWPAIWRCLEPGGACVLMASSLLFAMEVIQSQRSAFRYDWIWHKSLGTGHLNARKRPLRAHEFVLVFSERAEHAYAPQLWTSDRRPIQPNQRTSHSENYDGHTRVTHSRAGATNRYPISVLPFGSVGTSSPDRRHPQQKPVDLLRYLVRTYAREGGLVVDPYAGSGSAGVAAEREGRCFLGWDSDPRFGFVSPRDLSE